MKCIHCETNSNLKDRADGRCPKCGHAFAFEPTTDSLKMTDGLFNGAIQTVSAKGELFYTDRQLFWEINRFLEKKKLPGCTLGKKKTPESAVKPPQMSWSDFQSTHLPRWVAVHGRPEKLVNATPAATAAPVPAELQSYSFDRALIVESAALAAMLVANRFHFENNCAILSLDRKYPAATTFETVLAMLQRNPNLAVFTIHDCAAPSLNMAQTLRGPDWFPDLSVRIFDLGLRPGQLPKNGQLGFPGVAPLPLPPAAEALSESERTWLSAGNQVELSVLRPGKLMKSVYMGFSQASQYATGDAWVDSGYGFVYIGDPYPIWGGGVETSGMDSGGYDSFG
ncbi:MAG: hypothetical protein QM758_24270 [Armatimonas sp.]